MATLATVFARFNTRRRVASLVYAIAAATIGVDFNLASKAVRAVTPVDLQGEGTQTSRFNPGVTLTP